MARLDLASLETTIEKAFEERDAISASTRGEVRDAIDTSLALLDKERVVGLEVQFDSLVPHAGRKLPRPGTL